MDKLLGACATPYGPLDEESGNEWKGVNLPSDLCVSIDLETPNRRGPGIFTICAIPFNQLTGELHHNLAFYIRIDPMEVLAHPSTKMDPATLRWWMLQTPQAAREELFGVTPTGQKYPAYVQDKKLRGYREAMGAFFYYLEALVQAGATKLEVLGNGDIFDIGKTELTWDALGIDNGDKENPFPYQYWNIRDLREQIRFTKIATGLDPKQFVVREGVHHNALDDAIFQAKLSVQCTKIAMDVRDLMEQVKNGEIGHASDNS